MIAWYAYHPNTASQDIRFRLHQKVHAMCARNHDGHLVCTHQLHGLNAPCHGISTSRHMACLRATSPRVRAHSLPCGSWEIKAQNWWLLHESCSKKSNTRAKSAAAQPCSNISDVTWSVSADEAGHVFVDAACRCTRPKP